MSKARSFFERLTGSIPAEEFEDEIMEEKKPLASHKESNRFMPEEALPEEEAQLTIDMHQTSDEIIIEAMVAGVKPEDLDVSITQDMVTLKGKRLKSTSMSNDNYYYQELYWGGFSRSILLPQEVDSEEAEATMKNGLLTIKLPKLDKTKIQKLRIKNG